MNIKCHICGEDLKHLNYRASGISASGINSFRCDKIYKDCYHIYIQFIEKEIIFYSSVIYNYRLIGNRICFKGNYTEIYNINDDPANEEKRIAINKFLSPLGVDGNLNFNQVFEKIMKLKAFI